MKRRALSITLAGCLIVLNATAQAPDTLRSILERGHVRQWLVAGPFQPDVEGGIARALREGSPRLGDTDFMTPIGGIERARPKDRLPVKNPDGSEAVFQLINRAEAAFDLTPLLGDRTEAVGYAAFYAVADRPETVLLEVDSTLGARVAFNGALIKDISNAPVPELNTEWLVLPMRSGVNLVVFELPGASLDAVVSATGFEPSRLGSAIRRSRPMLPGASGFELGVRVHPVEEAGGLYVIPELAPTGAFTGTVDEPRKEVALRVFNATASSSQSVTATVTRLTGAVTLRRSLAAVPPGKLASLLFEVPMGTAAPGQLETLTVQVVHGASGIQFRTALAAEPPPSAGVVAYTMRPAAREAGDYLAAYRANALLTGSGADFGFHLGPAYLWRAGWARFPETREAVADGVLRGAIAPDSGYAVPDARLTSLDLFVRSVQIGRAMSEAYFADWPPVYTAWNQPAVPWRIADVFVAAGGIGLIENLPYPAREPYELLAGPGGASLPVRHKVAVTVVGSKPELRDSAQLQRAEIAELGLRTDVLIGEYSGLPGPFWADDAISLKRSVPSVDVSGDGARTFFESIALSESEGVVPPTAISPAWLSIRPGELVAQPELKAAHARTAALLDQAETFATLAAITGAAFPDGAIDAAWQEVLWASEHDRLGYSADFATFAAALSAYRRAADHAREVLDGALEALARSADTYTHAPSRDPGVQALVVFNSASFARTDLVRADIQFDQLAGFRLVNEVGVDIPYVADEVVVQNQRISRMRFSFVARDVPSFGYLTYYVMPEARPIVWGDAEGVTIESDAYALTVDPKLGGTIASLKWKETGREFARPGLNDVVAIGENADQNENGREIRSDGGIARASAAEAVVRSRIAPGAQRLEVRMPFGGGELVRTLTLFEGLDRVFCELRLEGVSHDMDLVGITVPAPEDNPQAVVGDGLGMRVARSSAENAPFVTSGSYHGGRAWEPAHGWLYLGPGDALRGGQDTGYPLRPARIVLDDDAFAGAAEELTRAFASVGVPADLFDVRPRDRGAYTDATRWENLEQSTAMGERLWVVLGDPQTAVLGLPAADPGSVRFWGDGAGQLSGPVLALYGGDSETLQKTAAEVGNAIVGGALVLGEDAIADAVELPNSGLAVLWHGVRLASFDRDRATLFLAHGGDASGGADVNWSDGTRSLSFHYELLPISGDWRSRKAPLHANAAARPLMPHLTNLHLGPTPQRHAFISVDGDGVLASGLRPASMKAAAAAQGETHPRDGVVMNIAETSGRAAQAGIRFAGMAFDAGLANASGAVVQDARTERGAFSIDLDPNGFALAGFRPSILGTVPVAPVETALPSAEWARPWEQGRGALPKGGLPLSLELRDPAPGEQSSVVLVIANNTSGVALSGAVRIETSEGWAVGAPEVPYELEPGEVHEETLLLLRGDRAENGYLLVSAVHNGVELVDVWPRSSAFTAVAERKADEVQVRIENTSAVPLIGLVELVSTPDTWSELGAAPGIAPATYSFRVNPYETRRALFTLPGGDWTGSLAAKVGFNGEVRYLRVDSIE